ncbi:uncharacterized protein [Watersipora subatra]|uniref:uncharacterized protein isoform X2 n=1 Tax=Watersipora subatra TaxID=2589382 RepID=UPI00355B6E69
MSLKVLLRCSDEEFERLISLMDIQGVLDVISELQDAMDKEQAKFDLLSTRIAQVPDQTSTLFQRLSAELVKSQQVLALLVSRNMHCFRMSSEPDDDDEEPDADLLDSYLYGNDDLYGNGHLEVSPSITLPELNQMNEISSETTTEARPQNEVATPSSTKAEIILGHSKGVSSPVLTSPEPEVKGPFRKQSTATLTVTSPRIPTQDGKPKRTLKVRTASLRNTRSQASVQDAEKTDLYAHLVVAASAADSLPGNRHSNRSPFHEPEQYGERKLNSVAIHASTPFSHRSFSSLATSPRSDISNLATPRSLVISPQLAVSAVLDLGMPETSIDDVNLGETETASDKTSYTTDESGFTSASSDSDGTLLPPDIVYDYLSDEEEKVEERVFMKKWSPAKLLSELYNLKLAEEFTVEGDDIINMEGYLERMPVGKNKDTLLKTWKRTYCKAVDGVIYFHDRSGALESNMSLMGGKVEEFSSRVIGIDDMRGHYLMVRCFSEHDFMQWRACFSTQIKCSPHTNYIQPRLVSTPSAATPKVIIVDLGSTNIRAGLLGSEPSYPQLFFPCVSSSTGQGELVIGHEAYEPENRVHGMHRPISSCKDVHTTRVNLQVLPALFAKIFKELKIRDVEVYAMLLSTPHNFSNRLKEEVLNLLLVKYKMAAVNIINQSLLTSFLYKTTCGVIVDIGERIEIVPLIDGHLVGGGLNRQSFGGSHMTDSLNSYLADYRLFTPVEMLIPRLVKEKTCFVSRHYGDDLLKYMCNESECEITVDLSNFDLPPNFHLRHIAVDTARFKAAEGLMKTELIGNDGPTLPKLIKNAIQNCSSSSRDRMWQSIYLSGGTTLTDGFAERLRIELGKLAPSSITIEVHTSPHRYHAAYIGACAMANMPGFLNSCVKRDEWQSVGSQICTKLKTSV